MTTTIRAVYQGGLLRPTEPLDLPDGTPVIATIHEQLTAPEMPPPKSPAEAEAIRRIMAARTAEELFAAANALPVDPDDDYDLLEALNENRRRSGAPLLYPPEYFEDRK